jgi:hypothetical protein
MARWHSYEAQNNLDIYLRSHRAWFNQLLYFDSAASATIQFPSKQSEVDFCRHEASYPSNDDNKGKSLSGRLKTW